MTNDELDALYKTTAEGDSGLLPNAKDELAEARDALVDAYEGNGRMSLTDSEISRLFKAAKRADVDWLPSKQNALESALDKLETAHEN